MHKRGTDSIIYIGVIYTLSHGKDRGKIKRGVREVFGTGRFVYFILQYNLFRYNLG